MLNSLFNSGIVARRVEIALEEAEERAPAVPLDAEEIRSVEIPKLMLVDLLMQHRAWDETQGKSGERADLTNGFLPGADLSGVNLRGAFLRKISLAGADLSFADLRGANLVHAGLEKSNLLHTRLREAGLQGANLEGATGLLPEQLAGTSLFGATLPKPLPDLLFQKLRAAMHRGEIVRRLFVGMLLAALCATVIVVSTTDLQIAKNAPVFPIPVIGKALPVEGFFMLGPLLLLSLYVAFHVALLRHWEQLSELPAVFPDGQALDRRARWPLMGLVRNQFRWLSEDQLPPTALQTALLILPGYWVVPAVLVVFWGRYLTRLDLHASTYHAGLVAAATILAALLPGSRYAAFRGEGAQSKQTMTRRDVLGCVTPGIVLGVALFVLSLGIVRGMPHGQDSSAATNGAPKWAAQALWVAGYNPYPNLAESEISARPQNWSGKEEDLAAVRGVRLDGRSFRYADAFGAFLANARLRGVNFENANLGQADLRGAVLREANLRSAILDRARATRAEMQSAKLQRARLIRADLRGANLAFAVLTEAVMVDATLAGATLFSASLRDASMQGINLDGADLREADLTGAKLNRASLRRAQLVSAQLSGAEMREAELQDAALLEADLHSADLRGATLRNACLARARLDGARVEGADLRGAACLSAEQLCTTVGWRDALLDDSLRQQAERLCGAKP